MLISRRISPISAEKVAVAEALATREDRLRLRVVKFRERTELTEAEGRERDEVGINNRADCGDEGEAG